MNAASCIACGKRRAAFHSILESIGWCRLPSGSYLCSSCINQNATTDRSPSVVVGTVPGSPVSHGGVEPGATDEGCN